MALIPIEVYKVRLSELALTLLLMAGVFRRQDFLWSDDIR